MKNWRAALRVFWSARRASSWFAPDRVLDARNSLREKDGIDQQFDGGDPWLEQMTRRALRIDP